MKKIIFILAVCLIAFGLIFGCDEVTNNPNGNTPQTLDGTWEYNMTDNVKTQITFTGNEITISSTMDYSGQTTGFELKSNYTKTNNQINISGGDYKILNQNANNYKLMESDSKVESVTQVGEDVLVKYKDITVLNFEYTIDDCFLELKTNGNEMYFSTLGAVFQKKGCIPKLTNSNALIGTWKSSMGSEITFTETEMINMINGQEQKTKYKLVNSRFASFDLPPNYTAAVGKMTLPYKLEGNKLIFNNVEYTKVQ